MDRGKFFLGHSDDGVQLYRIAAKAGGGQAHHRRVELEKLLHFFQAEAQLLSPPDELKGFEVRLAIASIAGGSSGRLAKQLSPFIKADGLDVYTCLGRKFADAHDVSIDLIPWYKVKSREASADNRDNETNGPAGTLVRTSLRHLSGSGS